MKLVLIHGDAAVISRERFHKIVKGVKKKGWETIRLNVDDSFSLKERLTSNSLFNQNILYIFEKANKIPASELKWLNENINEVEGSLLFYSDKKLPQTFLKNLPKKIQIENFDLPKIIFSFLDNLYQGNSKKALSLFEEVIKTESMEFIVALMARQFRDLYWVLEDQRTMTYPSWRLNKLSNQARKYTKLVLGDIIHSLAEIDYQSKTSDIDTRLLLELLIVENLK